MKIDETTYITITNRVRVSSAISLVRDILPGFDGVITEEEMLCVMNTLCEWEQALFEKIDSE